MKILRNGQEIELTQEEIKLCHEEYEEQERLRVEREELSLKEKSEKVQNFVKTQALKLPYPNI